MYNLYNHFRDCCGLIQDEGRFSSRPKDESDFFTSELTDMQIFFLMRMKYICFLVRNRTAFWLLV